MAASHGSAFIRRSAASSRGRGTLRHIPLGRAAALLICAALTGCGSVDEQPPAAEPAQSPPLAQHPAGRVIPLRDRLDGAGVVARVDGGRVVAVLDPHERVLEIFNARTRRRVDSASAGVGPTHVIAGPGRLIYVVDTSGDGLLVYELRPHLHITRRLPLLGKPYGIAADRLNGRLWVTMTATNRLVELADGARPHRLRSFPAVRQPDSVAVDGGRVYVTGRADGVLQIFDGGDTAPPTPRTAPR
jgi:DNA-binding beta-propeller fold protein YncE